MYISYNKLDLDDEFIIFTLVNAHNLLFEHF